MTGYYRRALLALLVVAGTSADEEDTPFVDVSSFTPHDLQQFTSKIEATSWWSRVGDTILSPSLATGMDEDASNYYIYSRNGPGGLPEDLAPFKLFTSAGLTVLHSAEKLQLHSPTHGAVENLQPIVPGSKMMVKLPRSTLDHKLVGLEKEKSAMIQGMTKQVTAETYMAEIAGLVHSSDGRRVGSPGHQKAIQYLLQKLKSFKGLQTGTITLSENGQVGKPKDPLQKEAYRLEHVGETNLEADNVVNVVGCLPGTESNKFVLLGGHYDSLPDGSSKAPGAMDDASGVGATLEAIKHLSAHRYKHTICAVLFDAEEDGCVGSKRLATMINNNPEMKKGFLGAIISDMATGFKKGALNQGGEAGWNDPGVSSQLKRHLERDDDDDEEYPDAVHLDSSPECKDLLNKMSVAANGVVAQGVDIYQSTQAVWNSDHKSFLESEPQLCAVDACAANHRMYQYWHHEEDTLEKLVPTVGVEVTKVMIAGAAELAEIHESKSMESKGTNLQQVNTNHPLKPKLENIFPAAAQPQLAQPRVAQVPPVWSITPGAHLKLRPSTTTPIAAAAPAVPVRQGQGLEMHQRKGQKTKHMALGRGTLP